MSIVLFPNFRTGELMKAEPPAAPLTSSMNERGAKTEAPLFS
ncbi:hypothetical protein B23_2176 [Geobacillus thermoleovorans B23]|nr:hypothetical protein B23_2176 [Geobacillus thermoleovorans B23]